MEEHAVPQNITTFEFKLFGPFTIRQFIYVAFGGIIAAIFYFSPLPKTIAYPISAIFVIGGITFAAVPLQGRPLDKWIVAFIRSISRPTQRIWIKDNHVPYFLEANFLKPTPINPAIQTLTNNRLSRADLQALLSKQARHQTSNSLDQQENQYLTQISNLASTIAPSSSLPPQNQLANQLNPYSPYQTPIREKHPTIQAAPKSSQLQAKAEEIKAQELALIQKQKELETTKIKLEEEKQKKLDLLSKQLSDKTTISPPQDVVNKKPESATTTFSQAPNIDTKTLPYPQTTNTATFTQGAKTVEESKQKLAELDQVLEAQKKIEDEIKAKEAEILRQQVSIEQEQQKFSQAWEEFKKNKNLSESGINTSTPDLFQKHMLPNLGKKTIVSPRPSSNFSTLNSQTPVSAQIASDINFGDNVIMIPGRELQFLQGIGDTRIRKLKNRPPDFSKPRLPILGERQFDVSSELKKRFEQVEPQAISPIQPIKVTGGIAIEQIQKVKDFEPQKAGRVEQRSSKDFIAPPSPNLIEHPKSNQPKTAQHRPDPTPIPKPASIVQPFNYKKNQAQLAPKAEVKINLSEHPNTPNGVVYDNHGGLVEGALISVYDHSGKPVRAFKTNGLGQFISVTPLPNGNYTIQTDFDGLNFDTIAFETHGKLLDPFAIKAKSLTA